VSRVSSTFCLGGGDSNRSEKRFRDGITGGVSITWVGLGGVVFLTAPVVFAFSLSLRALIVCVAHRRGSTFSSAFNTEFLHGFLSSVSSKHLTILSGGGSLSGLRGSVDRGSVVRYFNR
jgi:hypothetical protein